jgi:hypothetical protein
MVAPFPCVGCLADDPRLLSKLEELVDMVGTNRKRRYQAYRYVVSRLGLLGDRQELPECILGCIKAKFAEDSPAEYTGFKNTC